MQAQCSKQEELESAFEFFEFGVRLASVSFGFRASDFGFLSFRVLLVFSPLMPYSYKK
jgi:hypothetical protein